MKKRRPARASPPRAARKDKPRAAHREHASKAASFPIVGLGASAGGLDAFTQLLRALPRDTGMAFVLIQHLDPEHESALAQILSRTTSLPVREITHDLAVEADRVYVIPRDTNLTIANGVLRLNKRERARVPHRPIDTFFESLAEDQRERAIGVVLSGTASDGTLGLEAIKAEGGITFAQDDSAKYDSMPRNAVAAGCVDLVLSPAQIAAELARIARHPYIAGQRLTTSAALRGDDDAAARDRAEATAHEDDRAPLPSGGRGEPGTGATRARAESGQTRKAGAETRADHDYKQILLLLRNHSGVDFSLYKSNTVRRRVNRRMVVTKQHSLPDYAAYLRGHAKELDALYSDVLISVTSFFRNPETFEVLQREFLPKLIGAPGNDPIRCWVIGCSTGQEAYSIAMAFTEAMQTAPRMRRVQVFATDLNEALLDKARHGLYSKSLAADVSPERLRRFFVEEEGGYRVSKTLREMVVFARQNLVSDPPFSRMDLISCRNLLIYLEPALHRRALPTFHYALKPEGLLLLGASESTGSFTELFEPLDRKHKIYRRKASTASSLHLPHARDHTVSLAAVRRSANALNRVPADEPQPLHDELAAQREADRLTVSQFAPPGVLINADRQILQFRGPTGAYLEPPAGRASFDLLKMAREGLMLPLRAAINEAAKNDRVAHRERIRVRRDGTTRGVNLQVIPLKNQRERCFLVLFEEAREESHAGKRSSRGGTAATRPEKRKEEHARVAELEAELADTRDYLQSVQDQHEATNEELQASNEEVQSANEELQSINEELETSKEELESANEELTTLNEEMANRNVDLARLNSDLVNFQTASRLPVVLLGADLTLRRFTQQAEKQFDLLTGDIGRPLGRVRTGLRDSAGSPLDLEPIVREVIAELREQEQEVLDGAGRWFSLRVRPYLSLDGKLDGAVMMLLDIDALKRTQHGIAAARDYAASIVATLREPLLVLDREQRVESANPAFYRFFRVSPAETIGRPIFELGNAQWDIPRLRELLDEIVPRDTSIEDFEVTHDFEHIGRRTMLVNARLVKHAEPQNDRILLAIEDITERARTAAAARQSHDELESRAAELTRFNRAAVGRESRMIELKREVNDLRKRLGEAPRYALEFDEPATSPADEPGDE